MLKVDVSSHHNAAGKLYMPSYPWGIHTFVDMPGDPAHRIGSDSAKSKSEAIGKAGDWCDRAGRSATVFYRKDGRIVAVYSHDGDKRYGTEY